MNSDWIRRKKKPIGWILAGVLMLLFLRLYGYIGESHFYQQKNGNLIAIQREDAEAWAEIPLIVKTEIDGKMQSFQMTFSFSGKTIDEEEVIPSLSQDADLVRHELEEMVEQLEQQDDVRIQLPLQLSDGSRLIWKRPSVSSDFLVLLLFPLAVIYLYRMEKEAVIRKEKEQKAVILRRLPAFNDQILLLMTSGLIFHDAFLHVARGFSSRQTQDAFSNLITGIAREVEGSGKSIVTVMEDSKSLVALREYSRLVNMIADNQLRGVELKEKLESESRLLWESRKASALQKGKEIETKMTFPLAVLLLVVVMITGLPAMMSM